MNYAIPDASYWTFSMRRSHILITDWTITTEVLLAKHSENEFFYLLQKFYLSSWEIEFQNPGPTV